jgi:hypothetical protein
MSAITISPMVWRYPKGRDDLSDINAYGTRQQAPWWSLIFLRSDFSFFYDLQQIVNEAAKL